MHERRVEWRNGGRSDSVRAMFSGRASVVLLLLAACGPPPAPTTPGTQPPTPPSTATANAAGEADIFAPTAPLAREKLPAELSFPLKAAKLGPAPSAVEAAPNSCSAYLKRTPIAASCSNRAEGLAALDAALATSVPAERDAKLAGAEACSALPPGLVRALRAELAPVACGDTLTAPLVASPPAGVDGAVYDALAGIALGARLRRTVNTPPQAKKPHDKENLKKFIAGEMGSWAKNQAGAVQQLAAQGSALRYYGRAIVALEAGMADLRFIDAIRTVPAPSEYKGDSELENTYYGSLEASLDPRKQRGRDATLVGLGQLANIGVIRDPRVDRARRALTRMYGGRPIDALNKLLLPPLKPRTAATVEQRLAARLPSFYAGVLLPGKAALDPALLRQLIEKGVPPQHRIALAGSKLNHESLRIYGRARLELAQTYWRKVDIDEMLWLLGQIPREQRDADGKLFLAVGLALQGGPANAADMMVSAPLSELGIGNTKALDSIAQNSADAHGAMAAFNSALIAQLAAPATAPSSYWLDVARRYRAAAEQLADQLQRETALKLAADAEQTAQHIDGAK